MRDHDQSPTGKQKQCKQNKTIDLLKILGHLEPALRDGSPDFDVRLNARGSQGQVEGMGFRDVDHIPVTLQDLKDFSRGRIPDEDVAAITAAHDILAVVPIEIHSLHCFDVTVACA